MKSSPLSHNPYLYSEQWLWSVRIYSFGSLIIEVAGRLIEQPGKSQKKILELLATLVILGGRNISVDQLAEILWPDTEGDLARQSLATALHRLRKLIGKEAVILNSGMVSLNDSHCWLDLWVFEVTMDELENVLRRSDKQAHVIIKLTDHLLKLYRDTFLKNYDSGLAILKQEQLLNRLCHLLDLSVDFHEQQGEDRRACLLLEKELELKPLVEANYRRLMSHYIHLGQSGHALHIYQRCQRIIHKGFQISLSEEIHRLAKQLQPNERQ